MKVELQPLQKEYPYLAVWDFEGTLPKKIKIDDIVLISIVDGEGELDKQVYVQYLIGGKEGHVTKREQEYAPLPKGYKIILEQ